MGTCWEVPGARGREGHRCPRLGGRPSEDLQRMSRTPPYITGLLGRLRAKLGKEADVRMTCFTFQTIYKMAGMFCLSKKPFWQTFIVHAKGDNLSPQSRAPIGSRHSAKQRPQLPHEPHS